MVSTTQGTQGAIRGRNCRSIETPKYVPSWLGYFGCQPAAGYPETQYSLFILCSEILPTLHVE